MESSDGQIDLQRIGQLVQEAKEIAKKYRALTGKPLGITGEVAEYEAARLLRLNLCKARQAGYDAVAIDSRRKVQIKGRCTSSTSTSGQRLGRIRLDHEWDEVLLVLLDEDFEPVEIYSAQRPKIKAELRSPGSKARNERWQLSVSRFKRISELVWSRSKEAS
jgi:hypothetical protein